MREERGYDMGQGTGIMRQGHTVRLAKYGEEVIAFVNDTTDRSEHIAHGLKMGLLGFLEVICVHFILQSSGAEQ